MGNVGMGNVLVGAAAGAALGAAVAANRDEPAVQVAAGLNLSTQQRVLINIGSEDRMVESVVAGAAIGALVGMLFGKDATDAMGGQAREVPTAAETRRSATLNRDAEEREALQRLTQILQRARDEQAVQEASEAQAAQALEERKARDAAEIAASVSANF